MVTLYVTDQASNWCIIRVGLGTSKSQCGVPCISSGNIPRAQRSDLSLSGNSSILGSLVGTADIGQLILDSVGDNAWVEGLLLSFVDERVNSLEGECSGCTTVKTGLKLDGWGADSEVETGDGGFDKSVEVSGHCVGDCTGSNSWGTADKGASTTGTSSGGGG
jgi:hypothetical protein